MNLQWQPEGKHTAISCFNNEVNPKTDLISLNLSVDLKGPNVKI